MHLTGKPVPLEDIITHLSQCENGHELKATIRASELQILSAIALSTEEQLVAAEQQLKSLKRRTNHSEEDSDVHLRCTQWDRLDGLIRVWQSPHKVRFLICLRARHAVPEHLL